MTGHGLAVALRVLASQNRHVSKGYIQLQDFGQFSDKRYVGLN